MLIQSWLTNKELFLFCVQIKSCNINKQTNKQPCCFRYAITVWYFDSAERAEAKKRFRDLTGKSSCFPAEPIRSCRSRAELPVCVAASCAEESSSSGWRSSAAPWCLSWELQEDPAGASWFSCAEAEPVLLGFCAAVELRPSDSVLLMFLFLSPARLELQLHEEEELLFTVRRDGFFTPQEISSSNICPDGASEPAPCLMLQLLWDL